MIWYDDCLYDLEITKTHKYCEKKIFLAVIFDHNLSFDAHIQSVVDVDTFLRLHKTMVRPHLEYIYKWSLGATSEKTIKGYWAWKGTGD